MAWYTQDPNSAEYQEGYAALVAQKTDTTSSGADASTSGGNGRGHTSYLKDSLQDKKTNTLSAYLSNKSKYGSSDKWYDAAKEEEEEAKTLVEKLEQELKYREQTEWANSLTGGIDELYGVKNETSENYKSSEELSKELEQAKAKLKSAVENLKYADEWKDYDADTAWLETVDKSGQDWGFVSDNLKVMADNTSAVYEDAYKAYTNAIKQNEALNNRRDKVPSEVGYSYTSDEELARLEANMVQARELRDMASRRYGYSLDKLAEDEQSVARGELRAGHIAERDESAYSEHLQGLISGMESGELGSVTGVDVYTGYTRDSRPTDTWSQEQRNRYYVILDRNGEEAAAEYAVNVNTYNNAQALDDVHERAYAWGAGGETGIGRGALVTVGKVLTSAEGLISYTDKARRIAATGVYAGDAQPWLHDYLDPAAQGRADRLNTLGTVGGKGLGDIYQLTNSMAQSIALGNAAGMGVTLAAYFGQAADQGFDEAMSRGATPEQALQFGFYAGAAEAVAEIIPLENLLNANKSLTRGFLKSALIQAGLEGLEEGETALMTMLADEIAMKDKSAINAAIKERMEAGESYEDAAKAEWGNFVKDIAWSMVGGAISGAGAFAVQHGIVMGSEYENGYGVSAAQLGREAAAVTDNKSLAELGKKVEAKAEKGGSITNYTAKKLAEGTNRVSIVNATEQQVKERVPELNAKDARALANAIVSESRGEKNGPGNQKLIEQHRDVADSLLKELGKDGEVAEWAQKIGVRGVEAIKYGTPERVAFEKGVEEAASEYLSKGEYAEARAELIEKGQDKIEYATDFDYVAEVYGNRKKTENFEEAWEAIKGETVLTKAQAKAAWDAGKAKLSTADMSPKQKRKGSGKTSFEAVQDGDTTYEAPSQEEIDSFKRSARYEYLEELAKQIGVDIVFFKGGTEGINGKYKNGTVYLAIDASPSVKESVDGYVMLTAAHELTHYIREASPARYAELKDFVIEHLIEKGKMEGKTLKELIRDKYNAYAKAGVELGVDGVIEELIADACEMMLKDNRLVAKMKVENEGLHSEIVKWLKKFMSKVHRAFKGLEAHHTEAQAMMDSFSELQRIWNLGLTEATQGEFAPGEDGVLVDEAGEPVAMSTEDGSVQLSIKTYEDSGREAFRKYLEKCVSSKRLTEAEMQEMMDGIESIYQVCKDFKDKYAPFSSWSEAEVIRDTYGKPVFSVVTPNGDYKMNLDFSLVCRKRRTLDAVFNEMSKRGIIDDFELGQKSVVRINEIIRKHGFETACALCFVDAKRFRQAAMADSFVSLYNELVKSLVPESKQSDITHFNFGGSALYERETGKQGIDTWNSKELDFSHLREVMRNYGKGTVEHKAAKYIMEHAEGRKLLFRGDFMSSSGFDAVKTQNKNILKLYNSKKGTGGPKAAFGDVQYMNEILSKDRSWTPAKAYDVGGVRVQSFSDYVPRMVFDYVQMIYDLAAGKLPAHAYTKEALFVKQFGLTGIKINMSLIPAVAKDGIAAGLDARGNYVWAGESFDYNTAIEVQNADGYTENCGTICVGVSDAHIRKLLDDPNIRMVIPYHKSGLNPVVAHMNKVAAFTDYTNDQRTKDSSGMAIAKDFDFNKQLHKMGAEGDPKMVAQMYLDWCADNDYTPKFAEFAKSENYYKLLIDFTVYDKSGAYVPQREVKGVFPNEKSAFNSMAELIKSGLEEDAVIEGRRTESIGSIVDEIVNTLPKTEADIAEVEIEQAEGDVEAGYARDVSGGKSSIKETMDGRYVAVVDNDILSNIDTSTWDKNKKQQAQKAAAQAMKKFIAGVVSDGELKKVNKRSRDHFTRSGNTEKHYRTDKTLFAEKMRISSAVGDILTIAREWKLDGGLTHEREDNFVDFEKTNVLILSGNNKYSAVAVCGVTNAGEKVFYDIEQIEPTEFEIKKVDTLSAKELQNNAALANYGVSTDASVSQDSKEGNRNLSIKDEAMSDRMILANALMELAETEAEKAKLTEYQQMVDKLDETQVKLDLAEKELSKAYRAGDKDAIAKAQKERDKLGARLNRADRALVNLQATKPMRDMLNRAKREARYKTQRRIRDSATTKKYQERVFEKVDTLSKWLMKNSDKEHIPEALKAPLVEFLSSIDLRSKQMLKKGKSTAADKQHMEALEKLQKIASNQQKYIENGDSTETLDMFLDFGDLPDAIENYKDSIKAILSGEVDVNTESPVMRMSAEQLKDLDHILTVLTTAIRKANKFLQESHYAGVIEAARAGREFIDSMKREDVEKLMGKEAADKFFGWGNTVPYYAFKRFGEAGAERFAAFTAGWAKMAMNVRAIRDFTAKVYRAEQVKEWESEMHSFDIGGQKFTMSTAQIMGLYCSSKREQAMKHLNVGGMRIGIIKTGKKTTLDQKKSVHLTPEWIGEVCNVLSTEQLKVAEKLQEFMNTTCAEWGNEISMERFGYRQFTEENYYPIKSVEQNMDLRDTAAEETSLFRLINMSATKALNPNANNAILINSIFDVFAAHSADMAKYNGMALPVLDMLKWYNYKEKSYAEVSAGDETYTHMESYSVHKSIEATFGRNATNYISNFVKDLNGVRSGGRSEGMLKGFMGRYKAAAVAFNTRVIIQQPTSIVRAAYMINGKYLMQGAAMKGGTKEALEHSGLAQWKSMGFFDTNIARGVTEQIKGNDSMVDALRDKSMKGAEKADEMVFGIIWNACKLEQMADGYRGQALMEATTKRFNEVIVATQVMDSTITRSDMMRSDSLMMKELTSFKAEPTLSYNILLDSAMELVMEYKRTGNMTAARKKAWPVMWRAGAVYVTGQLATAAAAAIIDALRDDDEYVDYVEKWLAHFKENFWSGMNPLNILPIIGEAVSVALGMDSHKSMLFEPLEQLSKVWPATQDLWRSWLNSDKALNDPSRTNWGRLYQIAQAVSSLSGLPVAGAMREAKMVWNMSGGLVTGKKLKTYDSGAKSDIKYAFMGKHLNEEEAVALLLEVGEFDNADDAYWQVQEWANADNSEWTRYNELDAAILAGDSVAYAKAVESLEDHGVSARSARSHAKSAIGEMFIGTEEKPAKIDEAKAVKYLQDYAGLNKIEAQHLVDEWKFEKQTGVRYADLKDEFVAGTFDEKATLNYLINYGHEYSKDAKEKLQEWKCEKDTGIAFSYLSDAYIHGEISEKQAVQYLQKYGGETAAEAESKVAQWGVDKDYGISYGSSESDIKKALIEGYISEETAKAIMISVGDKTPEEAEDYVNQYLFTKETGYAWSEIEEAYADGVISYNEMVDWYKKASIYTHGSEATAYEYAEVARWKKDVEGAESMNRDGLEKWNKYGSYMQKAGLDESDFANAWELYSEAESQYNSVGAKEKEKAQVFFEDLYSLKKQGVYTQKEIEAIARTMYSSSYIRKYAPW